MLKIIPFLSFLLVLATQTASAFPELIRHGYVNCLTCHVSPSGGGALTDYGRTFSGEGLSTWSRPGEESIFHGLVKRESIPTWLSLGGDVRAVQTHMETSSVRQGRFLWMQADFEAAVRIGKLTLDATIGRWQQGTEDPKPKSRRYFAMFNFTDELMIRAGRFTPVYGINLPDHVISTRDPLGFGQGKETHNLEFSWVTDRWSAVVTGVKGPVETSETNQEAAVSAQIAYAFLETYKVGLNMWSGRSDKAERQLTGIHAHFRFTPEFYMLSEIDGVWNHNSTTQKNTQGLFLYNRLGYEVYRGIHLLQTTEFWTNNLDDATGENQRYGIGTQLFPRPHFDIQALWTKYRNPNLDESYTDFAWLVLHYYF